MQEELLSSKDLQQDGEAAQRNGCLSVLLFPPFSVTLFGALLLWGLFQFPMKLFLAENPANVPSRNLSPFFTAEVMRWRDEILTWAGEHELDPNLVATVMQIESCGNPNAESPAGAQGLFQVMPYHFGRGEDGFVPETNALRGLNYLQITLERFGGDVSLALAAYNGGISGASRPASEWAQETRDYQYWGENIYADAVAGKASSAVLAEWLAAGGASLCAQAAQHWAALQFGHVP